MASTVRRMTRADFAPVLDMLVRAFDDDPWFNFIAGQGVRRSTRMRFWLRRGLTKKTFPHGECYMTADASAAALWIPPNSGGGKGVLAELELRYALIRASGGNHRRVREAIRLIQDREPTVPHLELRIIAVDPSAQGQGAADDLLRPMLEESDHTRTPVALECTKQRNVAFYERFGFAVTNEIAVPAGPRLWGMWREPA